MDISKGPKRVEFGTGHLLFRENVYSHMQKLLMAIWAPELTQPFGVSRAYMVRM